MELINQIIRNATDQIREAVQQLEPLPFIKSLPSVLIEDEEVFRRLPEEISAIYFLTHPYEELLYIGKANNVQRRWRPVGNTHACLGPAIQLGHVKLSWWKLDIDSLSIVEDLLIKLWSPLWNGGVTDWIRKYRPELEWSDDVDESWIKSSESRRGFTSQQHERLAKLARQQMRDHLFY
jgi:hypothetical protein